MGSVTALPVVTGQLVEIWGLPLLRTLYIGQSRLTKRPEKQKWKELGLKASDRRHMWSSEYYQESLLSKLNRLLMDPSTKEKPKSTHQVFCTQKAPTLIAKHSLRCNLLQTIRKTSRHPLPPPTPRPPHTHTRPLSLSSVHKSSLNFQIKAPWVPLSLSFSILCSRY